MASISNRSAFAVKLTQALTKQNRSIFAQRRLKPEDVLPERRKSAAVLGGEANVERFVSRAAIQLGAPLQPVKQHFKLLTELLPGTVQERLAVEGLSGTLRIYFQQPAAQGATVVHRTRPVRCDGGRCAGSSDRGGAMQTRRPGRSRGRIAR